MKNVSKVHTSKGHHNEVVKLLQEKVRPGSAPKGRCNVLFAYWQVRITAVCFSVGMIVLRRLIYLYNFNDFLRTTFV